jgi:hypothetical protein
MDKNIQIPAVHDKDLRQILDKFGVSTKIDNGELFCVNCDEKITWENLFAFKVIDNSLVFFCDGIDCIENSSK